MPPFSRTSGQVWGSSAGDTVKPASFWTVGQNVFTGNFVGSGAAVGPVVLGGIRIPFGQALVGGEIRYQAAEGNLPADQSFAGTKIDLGGFNYLVTFGFRF